MNEQIHVSQLLALTDDEFLKAALLEAGRLGCIFAEEKRGPWRAWITDGEPGAESLSSFTIILPDGRLVTSIRAEERKAALVRVCRAAIPYFEQISAWQDLKRELRC